MFTMSRVKRVIENLGKSFILARCLTLQTHI